MHIPIVILTFLINCYVFDRYANELESQKRFSTPHAGFSHILHRLEEPSPLAGNFSAKEVISTSRTLTAVSGVGRLDSTEPDTAGDYSPIRPLHSSNVSLLPKPPSSASRLVLINKNIWLR